MVTIPEVAPSRFPERPIGESTEKWWIAKVKPRQEKQIALDLYRSGIEYYLPLCNKNTPRPGTKHKRIFSVPLFPGYICFAQSIPKDIYSTGRVVNLIEIRNQRKFIQEIEQIYRVSTDINFILEPFTDAIRNGMEVEIVAGVLKGFKGVVESQNSTRLILNVQALGSACLNVDKNFVRPIREALAA